MLRKTAFCLLFVLLVINTFTLGFAFKICSADSSRSAITVPDNFTTIQAAVDAATEGDTVFVRNGTYYEHVIVGKSLTLVGEGKNTIIDGSGLGTVVEIISSNVTLKGFTVQNGSSADNECLVKMQNASNNLIEMNNILGNGGLGIWVENSSNCVVQNNIVKNPSSIGVIVGSDATYWDEGVNNTVANNAILQCDTGIVILDASSDAIKRNDIQECSNGIDVTGLLWPGGLAGLSKYNIIEGNRITGSSDCGVKLILQVDDTNVTENLIANNLQGVYVGTNSRLLPSPGNMFYHNSFINNSQQFKDDSDYHPSLDNAYPSGGNYWGDYNGTDLFSGPYQNVTRSDGIGDSPYMTETGNLDHYPLINAWLPHKVTMTLAVPRTVVGQGYTLSINLTSDNIGSNIEELNSTLYANETALGSQHSVLTIGNYAVFRYAWNTTGFVYGNYVIRVNATVLEEETNTTNNYAIDVTVVVTISGDLNSDFKVSLQDLALLAIAFGSHPGDNKWNPNADINGNNVVDLSDLVSLANHYGQHYP